MGFADIVKYTTYLTDPARFDGFVSAVAKLTSRHSRRCFST